MMAWCALALSLALLGACGAERAATRTTPSISVFNITIAFAAPHPQCGQFVTGEYFCLGPVTLQTLAPAFNGTHHGWEVDPQRVCFNSSALPPQPAGCQGFDARVGAFNASLVPPLPLTVDPQVRTRQRSIKRKDRERKKRKEGRRKERKKEKKERKKGRKEGRK